MSSLQHEAVPSIYFVPTHHSFFLSSLLIYSISSACPCYSEPPLCINTVSSWKFLADFILFASHLLSIQFVMVLGLQIQIKNIGCHVSLNRTLGKVELKPGMQTKDRQGRWPTKQEWDPWEKCDNNWCFEKWGKGTWIGLIQDLFIYLFNVKSLVTAS